MRSLPRLTRGSANWPFIIALLLLLVFVYLWFDASDKQDKMKIEKEKAELARDVSATEARVAYEGWSDLSALVGWRTNTVKVGGNEYALSDTAKLKAQLDENGMDGDKAGMVNALTKKSNVSMLRSIRTPGASAAAEKPAAFDWMTAEFKGKVKEVMGLAEGVPPKPSPPADADDSGAQAKYGAEKAAYDAAVAQLQAAMDGLKNSPAWKQYNQVIRGPTMWDPDRAEPVTLQFYRPTGSAVMTVADAMSIPAEVIALILEEFSKNKSADQTVIEQQKGDLVAKDAAIAAGQTALQTEQTKHVETRTALTQDVTTANEALERVRAEARAAEQKALAVESAKKTGDAVSSSRISALESRIANDKEVADLRIRRDDPDGRILVASGTLGTASIDLGSADHVSPGLKFMVSYTDRGGDRQGKGEVMVTRVTGAHSSQATILSSTMPIVTGDFVSNPFFDKTDPIHVWFHAGKPDEIAMARLQKVGVVVDAQPSADTNYFVIPNDMTAAAAPVAEGEAAAAPGDDPLSRVEKMARPFGATVITQKMLERYVNP